jgi:hypothetical protein
MKKNSAAIGLAASAFNTDGTLSSSILDDLLKKMADLTTSLIPTPEDIYSKIKPYITS